MELLKSGIKIIIKKGDITEEECDAIVNAANSSLMGGGGVDGVIHRKGGKKIDEECMRIRREKYPDGLPVGEAVITSGGNLKSRFVIHTVGPVWRGGEYGEENYLKRCFINSLKLACENGLKCIAFPAISTGAYGYPLELAAKTSISAILEFIEKNRCDIKEIRIVLFTQDALDSFMNALEKIVK